MRFFRSLGLVAFYILCRFAETLASVALSDSSLCMIFIMTAGSSV